MAAAEEGEEGIEKIVETTTETAEETEIETEPRAGTTEIGIETETTGTVTEEIEAETNPGTDSSEMGVLVACLRCYCSFILLCLPVFLCCCCYRPCYVKCSDRRVCICPVLLPVPIRIHVHHFPTIFRGGKKASLSINQTIRRPSFSLP